MTRLRMRVAERLKGAQNTYAMLTTFNEVDMTSLMEMRNSYKVCVIGEGEVAWREALLYVPPSHSLTSPVLPPFSESPFMSLPLPRPPPHRMPSLSVMA